MGTDRDRVCDALRAAGVSGVDDFGRFVNNTKYFAASRFDADAATPILLGLFPSLTDSEDVAAVARHLQHGRIRPKGFDAVLDAFRRWATDPSEVGWVLGDTLARAADETKGEVMVALADDRSYGRSRQMIVYALWRWRATAPVEATLRALVEDPNVSLQAMSALGRVLPPEALLPILDGLAEGAQDALVQQNAKKESRKARRKLAR